MIRGSKGSGGGSQRPPVESPDSLISISFAKIIDLISEGDIYGLVNGFSSVYLQETPLMSNGILNFSGVQLFERKGTQDQPYITGFPSSESEFGVNVEVELAKPVVRAVSNANLSAVRVRLRVPRLTTQNPTTGDTGGGTIPYRIELQTDGGAWETVVNSDFSGKTTTGYDRSHRIDLPPTRGGWQIRVTRLNQESTSDLRVDALLVSAITEVIDAKFKYPNSALIGLQFDASQFSDIPSRAFHMKGRIIRVPTNYDPETRSYIGVWDGTFKLAYTNNPAWVYLDLLLNRRYGLGDRIQLANVNKWELYKIAQYCDQPVKDGKGGMEPRYTCNLFLQTRADALKVLQDVAQVFRGMAFWANGEAVIVADMPEDPKKTYNNTDVTDGTFSYKGASGVSQYNAALITWTDLDDFGRSKTEYVEDAAEIARQGRINKIELTATGCTSQGQAQRNGRWVLTTNNLEDETVSFTVGLSGAVVRPGHIIRIFDENRTGMRNGGRVLDSTRNSITVDAIGEAAVGDDVTVVLPNLNSATRKVTAIVGNTISWAELLEAEPVKHASWGFENDRVYSQRFRVTGIAEASSANTFTITALKHVAGKYRGVEDGTRIEQPPISVLPDRVQPAPSNVRVSSTYGVEQTMAVSTMTIAWDPAPGAVRYAVQWRKSDGNWVFVGDQIGTSEISVQGIYTGNYLARVMAFSAFDNGSRWVASLLTPLEGKPDAPPKVSFLSATGIVQGMIINWGFPVGSGDTLMTEIEYSKSSDPESMVRLTDASYPADTYTIMNLGPGVRLYFRARLRDRTGNVGEWSDIVDGMSSNEAENILDYLKGGIDESHIGKELNDRIDLIDGDGPGSVNERIEETKTELEQLISEYTDALVWDKDKNYLKGDIVRQGQKLYQALDANTNVEPPNATHWKDVGDILESANSLVVRVNNIEQDIVDQDGRITANQQSIQSLVTKVNDPVTGLEAVAGQVTTVKQEVTAIDGKVTAVSEKVDGVYAEIHPHMAGETTSYAGSTESQAGAWSIISAVVEGDYAQAQRTDQLTSRVDEQSARITTIETTTVTLVQALATRVDTLEADYNSNKASVQNQITAVSNAQGATASQVSTLQTTVNGHTNSIQQNTQLITDVNGKVTGSWSVRIQAVDGVGYKFAGIGLGLATNDQGVLESRFLVSVDQFAIYNINAAGQTSVPFAVDGGNTYIKSAWIQDGTITNAKIGAFIQSDNYTAGVSGWRLAKSGTMENNGAGDGYRVVQTNTYWRLYINTLSLPLVELGVLA